MRVSAASSGLGARNLQRILIGQFVVTHADSGAGASGYNKPIITAIFYAKYFTVYLESEYLMLCLIHNSDLLKGSFEQCFCCALLKFLATTMRL